MMSYLWIVLFCSLLAGSASAEADAVDPLPTPAPDNAAPPDDAVTEVSAEEENDKEPALPTEDTLEGDVASNPDQPSANPEIDLTETSDVPHSAIPVEDPMADPFGMPLPELGDAHDGMPDPLNETISTLPGTDDDVMHPSDVPHSAIPVEDPMPGPFGIPHSDHPDTHDGMPGTLNIPPSALPDIDDDVTDPSDVPHSTIPVEEDDVPDPDEFYPIKTLVPPQPEEPNLVAAVNNSPQVETEQTVGAPARVGSGKESSPSKGTQPGSLAGIVIGVVVAVVAAIAVYVAYQRKALCFKNRQEPDPEAGRKADTAEAQSEPQVLSNLLNSSQQ